MTTVRKYLIVALALILSISSGFTIHTIWTNPEVTDEQRAAYIWGDLENEYGRVYDTLTFEQRALVHFPPLDENCVYYVPKGYSYHAVAYCYTLVNAKTILSETLPEAEEAGLAPCSKCVGDSNEVSQVQ